jgi:hypothetical protein
MDKDSNKAWDDAKKSALVAQIVSGKLSVKSACERHDLSAETIQDWVRVFRRTTLQAFDEHLRQTFLIQGADAAALGSAEYTGTLDDIPIADLIQTFQMGGKGGVITITRDGEHSQIWCDRGEIIDAESGPLRGETAIYRILNFERGQVLADFHSEPRQRTIELPGNVLLLEAARRKDESARLLDRLGDERSIYRGGMAAAPLESTGAEREVLALCNGERSLREVLDQSQLGDFETLSALSSLVERRELVPYGVSSAPQSSPLAITVSRDTPHPAVSFLPLVASQRPVPPRRRRSPFGFIAAGVALGAVIWGVVVIFPRGTQHTAPDVTPAMAARAAEAALGSYELDSSVEPPQAELWLDGEKVGVGRLRRVLLRDGTPHSLRIVAEDHAPTTLLFVDAPPPSHIQLEPLNRAAPAHAAPSGVRPSPQGTAPLRPSEEATTTAVRLGGAASEPAAAAMTRAAGRRPSAPPRVKRGAAPPGAGRVPAQRLGDSEHDASGADEASRTSVPHIQIIEDDMPVVQVIE